ncbi:glycine oxidase ThiO [Cellulosimicrobium protaetiae]|uniref:glycine oxidase n=1 Tax=Cellulosimicrobium protaetiae TaxID=2587808 RepID=A0A6M5UJW8_9MICO|nr:glycine oxidase ThiO [Cellulosimicrobium protaetiae]QJW37511.1 glycine oxidase ThiO [Cellulosimicrobium protaetiae]
MHTPVRPGPRTSGAGAPVPDGARDVVVVGGGIVGLAVAWRAARAGLTVTVLDPAPGDGATHAAAGMLAPVTEADFGEDAALRLHLAAAATWPGFAADLHAATGADVGLRTAGTLTLAYDADDLALLRRVLALHAAHGLASHELTVADARRREPYLGPRVAGAAWAPADHAVDPRAAHAALLGALDAVPGAKPGTLAGADGGSVVHAAVVRASATRLALDPAGRVVGVHDDAGRLHRAGAVVVAAGWESGALLADVPGAVVPTRPVKGQTLRLDAGPDLALEHVVRGVVQGRPVYVVPRDPVPEGQGHGCAGHREVVVGATSEENPDDRRATAGGVFALLRDARALLPGIDEAALVDVTPRARPATPDNLPLVGPTDVPGLHLATGHGRNGILLAPLTAAAVVAGLTGAALPTDAATALAPTRPDRFAALSTTTPR